MKVFQGMGDDIYKREGKNWYKQQVGNLNKICLLISII